MQTFPGSTVIRRGDTLAIIITEETLIIKSNIEYLTPVLMHI